MMKIYAKQVPPEYQESPLEFWDDIRAEIFGNRKLRSITSALFDRLPGMLDDLAAVWDNIQSGEYNGAVWADELRDLVPPQGRESYTRDERREAWPRILEFYCDSYSITPGLLRDVLGLITGKDWAFCTLRGCCQSDWQYCIYPVDEWNGDSLERLEAEYFNTGSEWIVHDDQDAPDSPEDVNGYSVYCVGWNDDLIRKEIADAAGGRPEDVTLYRFTGYTRRAEYEEVI